MDVHPHDGLGRELEKQAGVILQRQPVAPSRLRIASRLTYAVAAGRVARRDKSPIFIH